MGCEAFLLARDLIDDIANIAQQIPEKLKDLLNSLDNPDFVEDVTLLFVSVFIFCFYFPPLHSLHSF